jgi:hypothetical protein
MTHLRLFRPESDRPISTVPVRVADLVPLLVDAWQSDRTWLNDFASDEASISNDLYEVLLAYQQLRRCEAA